MSDMQQMSMGAPAQADFSPRVGLASDVANKLNSFKKGQLTDGIVNRSLPATSTGDLYGYGAPSGSSESMHGAEYMWGGDFFDKMGKNLVMSLLYIVMLPGALFAFDFFGTDGMKLSVLGTNMSDFNLQMSHTILFALLLVAMMWYKRINQSDVIYGTLLFFVLFPGYIINADLLNAVSDYGPPVVQVGRGQFGIGSILTHALVFYLAKLMMDVFVL